jgi:hypothetical protein
MMGKIKCFKRIATRAGNRKQPETQLPHDFPNGIQELCRIISDFSPVATSASVRVIFIVEF